MLFFASDLLGLVVVPPVLDPAVLAGSGGDGTAVGLAVAPAVAALWCARGGCSPGITPSDLWHPASVTTAIVSPRTNMALVPMRSRRHDRDGRRGEACPGRRTASRTSCWERADPYGGSGTGESIR